MIEEQEAVGGPFFFTIQDVMQSTVHSWLQIKCFLFVPLKYNIQKLTLSG
jgi:hypothetical protein